MLSPHSAEPAYRVISYVCKTAHRSSTNRFYTHPTLGPTQPIQHTIVHPRAYYSTSVVLYTKLQCMTPATDPTRGVSAHASIQHATIPHSPQFTTNRFHTSPIQHNPFLHISFSTQPVSTYQFLSTKLVLHHRFPFLHTNISQVGKVGRHYGLPTWFP